MTGHQHHFLSRLDRVSTDHVELALTLYRDDQLLKYFLQCAKLPEGAERVAISLEHPEEGPFLVVTRDGHFVTCLGAGMKPADLPVLTRGQLDALTSKVSDLRARIKAAQVLAGPGGETAKLLDRIYKAGAVLSREEFIAISAFQPILDLRLLSAYLGAITRLQDYRERLIKIERPKPALTPVLRAYWDTFWAIGHLAVLAFMDGRALIGGLPPELDLSANPLSWGAVRQGICALAVRGCWAVAKVGKAQMKPCKDAFDNAQTPLRLITASTALTALGLRHAKLRAEARKALAGLYDPSRALYQEGLQRAIRQCTDVAFDHPEQAATMQRIIGAKLAVRLTRALPPEKGYRFERDEDVPEDLAMTLAANSQQEFIHSAEGILLLMISLPWAARAEPEQFFLPRDFIRAAFPRWQPADTMELLAPLRDHYKAKGPVQREGPTRNGPCPCRSGKKYKRCCGAESG